MKAQDRRDGQIVMYGWDTLEGEDHQLVGVAVAVWMADIVKRTLAWRVWGEGTRTQFGPVVHLDRD